MDHLPFEIKAGPSLVPYYPWKGPVSGSEDRGKYGLDDILPRVGQIEANTEDKSDDEVQVELMSFVQQRLFFDTLEQVFGASGLPYQKHDFYRSLESGQFVISTKELQRYIYHWHVLEDATDGAITQVRCEDHVTFLDHANYKLKEIEDMSTVWAAIHTGAVDRAPRDRQIFERNLWFESASQTARMKRSPIDLQKLEPFSYAYSRADMIALSIRLLFEELSNALASVFQRYHGYQSSKENLIFWNYDKSSQATRGPGLISKGDSGSFLEALLNNAGWCPREITSLRRRTPYVASQLYRLEDVRREKSDSHDCCSLTRCQKQVVDPESYETMHRSACTGCKQLSVSCMAAVDDATGLFTVQWDGTKLQRRPVQPGGYVAISHVWSDGMGDPSQNTLPECVVSFLQRYVDMACVYSRGFETSSIFDAEEGAARSQRVKGHKAPVPFWIDTLCVSVRDMRQREFAIRQMPAIYRDASVVLVIDSTLETRRSSDSEVDNVLALGDSVWTQRLWTLQECQSASNIAVVWGEKLSWSAFDKWVESRSADRAALDLHTSAFRISGDNDATTNACVAKLLSAAFLQDGVENAGEAKEVLLKLREKGYADLSQIDAIEALQLLDRLNHYRFNQPYDTEARNLLAECSPNSFPLLTEKWQIFWRTIFSLRTRSTSHSRDEAVCLASMFNLDVSAALRSPDDRSTSAMKAILIGIGTLPKRFLFFMGERFLEEGSRWVPRSLLFSDEPFTFQGLGPEERWVPEETANNRETSLLKPTEGGLLLRSDGLIIREGWRRSPGVERGMLHVRDQRGHQYSIIVVIEGKGLHRLDVVALESRELAVILHPRVNIYDGVLLSRIAYVWDNDAEPNRPSDVLDEDVTIQSRFEALCIVAGGRAPSNLDESVDVYTPAERLGDAQRWTVV